MKRTPRFLLPAAICLLVLAGAGLFAGPLDPPAGPIAPTPGPEPRLAINATNTPGDSNSLFKIRNPGSYYLAGNITGVAGKHGIEIESSNVTIDLMGFALIGASTSLYGINTSGETSNANIIVRNGTVRDWGAYGIDLFVGLGKGGLVEGVVASGNDGVGIRAGDAGVVRSCVAHANATGFFCSTGTVIEGCVAMANSGNGISAFDGTAISNCSAIENGGAGISSSNPVSVVGCMVKDNVGPGIAVSSGSTVRNCTVSSNDGTGISVLSGSSVTDCTVSTNGLAGIVVSSDCTVRGNTCDSNGLIGNAAGILVNGADNRIEGNNCTDNDLGIVLQGAGNVMLKNTCSGNTINYDIFTGNRYGPIINITASNPATVSGNSAPSTIGSTDPWANFAF